MKRNLLLAVFVIASLSLMYAQNSEMPSGSGNSSQQTMEASNPDRSNGMSQRGYDRIVREVHHELVMLPRYDVFDDLSYKVDQDGTVTLMGAVHDPTIKSDAESVVKKIEGVERVNNQIEVLPASPMDDRIRRATYRAIYGNDVLSPYSMRAVPPIHIIVDNGHVTLTGVVARQMDKQIAETQAKSVPGVFSVTNNIQVEDQSK